MTNGTILPDERTLNALKHLNGKLEVHIDSYGCAKKKAENFYGLMQEYHIPCIMTEAEDWEWKQLGEPDLPCQNIFITAKRFQSCWNKRCYTLANGLFTCCPRGITTKEVFGQKKRKYEFCSISNGSDRMTKALIATCMDKHIYKAYCRYCLGMTSLNQTRLVPGIQIKMKGKL